MPGRWKLILKSPDTKVFSTLMKKEASPESGLAFADTDAIIYPKTCNRNKEEQKRPIEYIIKGKKGNTQEVKGPRKAITPKSRADFLIIL